MTKPQIITSTLISAITVLGIGSYATGAFDPAVMQTQIDNHEKRITTLEAQPTPTPNSTPTQAAPSTGSVNISTPLTTANAPTSAGVPVSSIIAPSAPSVGPTPSQSPGDAAKSIQTPQPTPQPTPAPVTSDDLQYLFGRLGAPGAERVRKVLFCYSLYRDHKQDVSYAEPVCGSEPQLETYSNY